MTAFTKHFLNTTAADLMNAVVIAVPRQMSIKGAAHLLAQNRISGAPVVDDAGRCIGVVSATDFVFLAGGERRGPARPTYAQCFCSEWSDPVQGDDVTVERVMTGNPVTAGRDTPIGELAQKMLDAHIHRIIIVDESGHPVGVVSSTDMLAGIARASMMQNVQEEALVSSF